MLGLGQGMLSPTYLTCDSNKRVKPFAFKKYNIQFKKKILKAILLPCGFVRSDSAAHYVPQSWLCLLHILLFFSLLLIDAATAANMNAREQLIKPPSQRQCCIYVFYTTTALPYI